MQWILLEGMRPWDGRYEFEGMPFTTREWGWIKRLAGYSPFTLEDGWDVHDPELFAVFAVIALRRAGKIDERDVPSVFGRIIDTPYEFRRTITFENDTPAEPGEPDDEAEDGGADPSVSSSGNGRTSTPASPKSSESSTADLPPPTGTPASATSESHPTPSGT